jgi:hypothetical protein
MARHDFAPRLIVDNSGPEPTADLAGMSSADITRDLSSIRKEKSWTITETQFWAGVLGIAAIALVVIVGLFMRAV